MFPIVAIGASAGGLEAVSELLAALPPRTGMAFILVQHLDPDHESLLAEILAKKTALRVVQVQGGEAVQRDQVYVIPPNAELTLDDEHLRLTPRASGRARHMPVDALFRSLADSHAHSAIGVVLSGGDTDGTLGLQAIKHAGGITFAQDPASARFPSMPRSAIESRCADFVLQPHQIAHELLRLGRHPFLRSIVSTQPEPEESSEAANPHEEDQLRRIFRRLRAAHGVDFTHYKRSTLRRRVSRRMALRKIEDLADYAALVEGDPAESALLYQDFLIRVTGFFRDPEVFQSLAQHVLPRLCEGRSPKEPIRVWVPGCATGEEVYSIAMAFAEYLGDHSLPAEVQIFGSDVSETAIEKARAGLYPDSIAQGLSSERLRRFFVKQDDHYRIAKSIRDLCIFARQDVTRDPPFSRLDLLSCRNLLIYLDATAQRRVMQFFHYALRPQGILMLGPSESVGQASDLFELTDKHHRLYVRRTTAPAADLDLAGARLSTYGPGAVGADESISIEADSAHREADRLLLARYAPASLLVDDALNILQFRGETGPYIEHASGPSSLNLIRVARPELMVEIAPAIQEARESGAEARREGLCIDDLRDVSIEVIPLKRMSAQRCFLILFEDGSSRPGGRRAQQVAAGALPESEKDLRLAQFAREVASIRDYLQATMEEHEAVKEELKSAHEEVLSANEEFQSTNEELETAKEELQSTNEELTTTNEELRNRNRELAVLNAELEKARQSSETARAYGDAIVETAREPLLVLDSGHRILRANQAFYALFKTRPEDALGRLLSDVGGGPWKVPLLREHLDAVLTRNEPITGDEVTCTLPELGLRVMSLSARKIPESAERPELILLSIEDITERRAYAEGLRESGRHKDEFLAMLAHELRNPLAPITHAVELLRSADTAFTATELYEMIERQSKKLERIVEDLVDLARVTRGMMLKPEPVDLVSVVQHAAAACRGSIEERQHELSLALPDAPVVVHGDAIRLEQVLFNLLENAAKYTNPGGRIGLALTQEKGEAVLTVRDNGIGLAGEMLESIFDLFTQADTSLARTGGGLGIGLTLVRQIVELHGGRIEARSSGLGEGSEFIVRLPHTPPLQAAPKPGRRAEAKPAASAPRGRRVLVVDDNADSARSMALLARSWGHEVAVARDGPEALGIAASFKPDVALVDIGLPGMDGYELARRLRQDPGQRDLYLMALTGYGRPRDVDAARAAGFDRHLVKAADLDELRKVLAGGGLKRGA